MSNGYCPTLLLVNIQKEYTKMSTCFVILVTWHLPRTDRMVHRWLMRRLIGNLISDFCSFYTRGFFKCDNCQQKAGNEKTTRTMHWYSTIMGSHLSAKHICQHTRIHNSHLILDPILPPLISAFCSLYWSSDPAPFLKVLRRPNMLAANTSAGSL